MPRALTERRLLIRFLKEVQWQIEDTSDIIAQDKTAELCKAMDMPVIETVQDLELQILLYPQNYDLTPQHYRMLASGVNLRDIRPDLADKYPDNDTLFGEDEEEIEEKTDSSKQ